MKEKAGLWMVGAFAMSLFVFAVEGWARDEVPEEPARKQEKAEEKKPTKIFDPLVRTVNISGVCEVNNPDVGKYIPALLNKAYPLGSTYRTGENGSVVLLLSGEEMITLEPNTVVKVSACKKNPDARVVEFYRGSLKTTIRENPPEKAMNIITRNASCFGLAGRGEYTLGMEENMETFQAATITGTVCIEGPQFSIPALRAANTVNIKTAQDRGMSRLTSVSGDFNIILPNGTDTPLTYGMSPMSVVKIWRENAPVGGRPLVSVLAMNHKGITQNRFAYAIGRSILSTGELVTEDEKKEEAAAAQKEKKEGGMPALVTKEDKKADRPADQKADGKAAE